MTRAFIGIGSNIHPEENFRESIRLLSHSVTIAAISTVYQTEPENRPDQPPYLNGVVAIETGRSPLYLKYRLLRLIEEKLGRLRTDDRYASRTIDLDLLLYDDVTIATEELVLPDPDIFRRPYVAIPLAELAPGLVIPGMEVPIEVVSGSLPRNAMKALPRFTESLLRIVPPMPRRLNAGDSEKRDITDTLAGNREKTPGKEGDAHGNSAVRFFRHETVRSGVFRSGQRPGLD
ncbi:MAG: 2-amino-4-hydroxy-6-hydroxymethyldihydropteridine diphosphokinase [Chitinispirillaceae bacterium]|nr:2-amino-4-hydroxy-6-hydroxymethyldihydropteridine diphosphokinase [Chitinispirillaceae bacterium]